MTRKGGDRSVVAALSAFYVAPLWPAGHLPLKGGDHAGRLVRRPFCEASDLRRPEWQPISPVAGEMAGRPEGGNVERRHDEANRQALSVSPSEKKTGATTWQRPSFYSRPAKDQAAFSSPSAFFSRTSSLPVCWSTT